MQIEGTVNKVEGRRTSGDPLYFIDIDGTDYSTFEEPTAKQALAGKGLRGRFEVEEKPNPRNPSKPYKNLIAVLGWHGTPTEVVGSIPWAEQSRSGGGGRGRSYGKSPEERREISRMNANNVAFTFVGRFAENGAFSDYAAAEATALALSATLFGNAQEAATETPASEPTQLTTPEGLTPPTPGNAETWGQ